MSKRTGVTVILITLIAIALVVVLSEKARNGPSKTSRPDSDGHRIDGSSIVLHPDQITKKTFIIGNVKIDYPQITGLEDHKLQKTINALLRSEALKIRDYYAGAEQSFTLEIYYQLKLVRENLLSVQYAGSGYVKGAAYPNNLFSTINIDLEQGKRLRLSDLVKIDPSLVKLFQSGKLKALNPEHNEILKSFTPQELLHKLKQADSANGIDDSAAFSYLTETSLGISLGIPHALGDHAEFEIKYREIPNHLFINSLAYRHNLFPSSKKYNCYEQRINHSKAFSPSDHLDLFTLTS